jgi:subtilase family serine protease
MIRPSLPVASVSTSSPAQTPQVAAPIASRITQALDTSVRVTIGNTVPRAATSARDLGALDSGHAIQRMILVLKPSDEQQTAMKKLLDSQQAKTSTNYHKWLTPAQFAASFGPSDDDLAKVKSWLQSQGLQVTGVGNGRQWIEFSGAAGQVNNAFHTNPTAFPTSRTPPRSPSPPPSRPSLAASSRSTTSANTPRASRPEVSIATATAR